MPQSITSMPELKEQETNDRGSITHRISWKATARSQAPARTSSRISAGFVTLSGLAVTRAADLL
jgi:hypothetical protein